DLVAGARRVGALSVVAADLGRAGSADDVRAVALKVRERLGSDAAVVALGGEVDDRPVVIVATTEAARSLGVKAGPLAKAAATTLGGGGGGRDDLAQGGGSDVSALARALDDVVAGLPRP
ncbi:MAG TPA: alanine--tRNA ligase, partial [Microbacterium sp.]|nr:alanine--tRNA ligase [Microbacterium sp.]